MSPVIRPNDDSQPVSPRWVQVYRELVEWATLFSIIQTKDFATDTLIVSDGLLRSTVFSRDLFGRLLDGIHAAITEHARDRRRILINYRSTRRKACSR